MNRYIQNKIDLVSPLYDGSAYSGVSVALTVDGYIDVPVNATLGSDTKQTATLGDGWTDNGSHSYTGATADGSLSDLSSSGVDVEINFTISNYSAGAVEGKNADGTYVIISHNEELTASGFSGDVLINSVKEITQVQGSVTHFDYGTNEFIQNDNLPLSAYFRLENLTTGAITKLATNHFTDNDLTKLNSEPELMIRFGLGEDVGLSITKDAEDRVYYILNSTAEAIGDGDVLPINGTYTYNTKLQHGVQQIPFELNATEIPTAYNPFKACVVGGGFIDTGWKPDWTVYTIRDIVQGNLANLNADGTPDGTFSYRMEDRVLIKDYTETRYYIDGKQVTGYTPALPDENEIYKLTDTALIGYADTIEYHQVNFEVWSKTVDPTYVTDRSDDFYDAICPKPDDELLTNPDFDCDTTGWDADTNVDTSNDEVKLTDGKISQEI